MSKMDVLEAHYKKAYSQLVKRYKRQLGSEQAAEDVVQEAYCRAIRYIDRWDEQYGFEPWLAIILRNAFRDQLNQDRGIVFVEINEFNHEGSLDNAQINDLKAAIRTAMKAETPEIQDILHLYFFAGYTGKEIADISPFGPGYVRQVVFRFKNKFLEVNTKE